MYKKIVFCVFFLVTAVSFSFAAKSKGGSPALVKVTSFDRQGKPLSSGVGFFISPTGEAVASYDVFKQAWSAKIVDAKGRTWNVTRISGASDLYDVVKFRTDCSGSESVTLSDVKLKAGVTANILTEKSSQQARVQEASQYEGVTYYTLAVPSDDKIVGSPVVGTDGKVVAIVQKNADKDKSKSYAVDIDVARLINITPISASQPALSNIHIAKQLPDDATQAASYLYLLAKNTQDTLSYLTGLADFIQAYPDKSGGYMDRATYYAYNGQYEKAEADYNAAVANAKEKGDVYYAMSKLLYQLNLYQSYKPYKDWTLNRALTEAQQAQQTSPNPLYQLQVGDCQFALKQYNDAYNTYQEINRSPAASSQTFFYAARARELVDDDSTTVLALLDSAMSRFSQPYRSPAGPYLLQRAQHRDKYGFYKAAALDYRDYEKLVGVDHLNDAFFYQKEQCDLNARLYPWALEDIDKALAIKPNDYLYLVEKAVVELRVGNNDEAEYAARQALKVKSDGADAYKVLGIVAGQNKKKSEALRYLNKAKELGDPQAEALIKELK